MATTADLDGLALALPRAAKELDVLVFRVDGLEVEELLLSDVRGVYVTTPHGDG